MNSSRNCMQSGSGSIVILRKASSSICSMMNKLKPFILKNPKTVWRRMKRLSAASMSNCRCATLRMSYDLLMNGAYIHRSLHTYNHVMRNCVSMKIASTRLLSLKHSITAISICQKFQISLTTICLIFISLA